MISTRIGVAHGRRPVDLDASRDPCLRLRHQPGRAHRTSGGRRLLIGQLGYQVLLACGFSQGDAANVVTAVRAELHPELGGRVGR